MLPVAQFLLCAPRIFGQKESVLSKEEDMLYVHVCGTVVKARSATLTRVLVTFGSSALSDAPADCGLCSLESYGNTSRSEFNVEQAAGETRVQG